MANRYLGVDPMLTNVAVAYKNDNYIADKIFLPLPVMKQSGKHFVYDKSNMRIDSTVRGKGANSHEVELGLSTGSTYFCEDHSLKMFVADEDLENAITPTSPFVDATENVVDKLLLDKEKALATYMSSTSNMTSYTTLSGTSQWSDLNNSDPFAQIETGNLAILDYVGKKPNTLILGYSVFLKLRRHPELIDRIKYSGKGFLTADLIAEAFDVQQVLIGDANYNDADEGQTDSLAQVWGKHAWLAYIAPSVSAKMVTLGFTYQWMGKSMVVERLRGSDEEDRKGTFVRGGNMYYDQQVVDATCAYFIQNAIA
jgi:hypothetical protein